MTAGAERIWAAFATPAFRWLWLASIAINLTIWMQGVAAGWLMVSLTTSPLMVALIQTASALPSFIFALPSGVMADLLDRRRYLIAVIGFMICIAAVLCMLSASGGLGPWMLLFLTFCLGTGFALQGPAWYTAQTDAVTRLQLASAMALSSVSYSSARAIGPAMAGAVVSSFGVLAVFVCSAVLLGGALVVLFRWKNAPRNAHLPPEDLFSGMRSAVRYVRHSEIMKAQVLRTSMFVGVSSSLWALLPLIAELQLNSGARGYGLLLGSMGCGSVAGALILPRLRSWIEMNRMMAIAAMLYAASILVAAFVPNIVAVCSALFIGGAAWLAVGNTNMIALQSSVPAWIRARAVAVYMLVFQGAMAAGSAFWGVIATEIGMTNTLLSSALLMSIVLVVMYRVPARLGHESEATQSSDALHAGFVTEAVPSDASVAIQIVYQVAAEKRKEFLRQLYAIGKVRRRDGASFWRAYRDLEQENCYVERFIVESWDQYLRQRGRATVADLEAERQLWTLHSGPTPPAISHFVSEPCP
ncbi:MFS transporter [Noviherbaspirillum saxi]|uniref:MFS transporter n=1 Tax=Noviherbaspirillum saxi TaxID=2320863 RepID=A0A3A3FEN9_9BURK|nr:MFS transporter [Noviherbaspirillum saxi]RJF91710.1 MFS transporter [Noviherbaspirillum saxi]